ncbi:MAG: PcfJ domain-containing protein [Lachnospiraceae bacterium]|nr:PcfJ domain-containing protein [Lachnospiraceae bacterium]
MSQMQISLLSREDLTIQELHAVMDYFIVQHGYLSEYLNGDMLAEEAEQWIKFLIKNKNKITTAFEYKLLMNAFLPSYEKDNLIGNRKKIKLFKMYRYLMLILPTYMNKGIDISISILLKAYKFMLYRNFSSWHISTILRPMILNENYRKNSIGQKLIRYPSLMDEYLYSGKESFLYFFAVETNILSDFLPEEKEFEKLYDYDKHSFLFKKNEFSNYFLKQYHYKINLNYLFTIQKENYPIIGLIETFCQENNLKPYNKNNGIYITWKTWQLMEPNREETLKECYKLLGKEFTTEIPAFYFGISINSNFFVTVTYIEYKSIYIGANNDSGWKVNKTSSKYDFTILPDGRLFKKRKKVNKLFPLPMKVFIYLYRKQNICGSFMVMLSEYFCNKNLFYNEVISDFVNAKPAMPLTFNEVAEYHNRAELLHEKYKISLKINIKWNKINLNLAYLIIKAYHIVEPNKSRQILLQQKNTALVNEGNYNIRALLRPYEYVENLLHKIIHENEMKKINREDLEAKYRKEILEEIQTDVLPDEYEKWIEERIEAELPGMHDVDLNRTIKDYVSMCRQSKIKIRLDIYSIKQLEKLHGKIVCTHNNYRKNTQEVKVPINSKFLPLRDILPSEFEWIKTRKRLILETEMQHHCVWSYAPDITQDKCAIYSFTDTRAEYAVDGIPKRYTIEFKCRENGIYYVEQVQGKYDKVNAHNMNQYIQSLLEQYMNV